VLFLYRHSLELSLKAVVYRGAQLMDLVTEREFEHPELFKNHGLVRLLPAVKQIFAAMHWTFEGTGIGSFDTFEQIVKDVERIDPQSYAFRYPVNKDGKAILDHHLTVNVAAFGAVLYELLGYLEGAASLLQDQFEATAEARYETQQLMAEHRDSEW
jgi:hypothetical protein